MELIAGVPYLKIAGNCKCFVICIVQIARLPEINFCLSLAAPVRFLRKTRQRYSQTIKYAKKKTQSIESTDSAASPF